MNVERMIEAVIIGAREDPEYAFCVAEWPDFEDTWRSALRYYFELVEHAGLPYYVI